MKLHKIISTALLILGVTIQTYALNTIDSLYRVVDAGLQNGDTMNIINACKDLGDLLSEEGEFEKADSILNVGLNFSNSLKNTYQAGLIYNLLATNASYSGNRQKALSYYHRALKAFTDCNNADLVAMVMMNMGSEYEFMGNLKKSMAYKLKALKNKEISGNREDLDYYYQNIGQLFKETNIHKWEYYIRKAYEVQKTLPEIRPQTKAAIFNDLAGIADKKQKFPEALLWYDSLINFSRKLNYLNGLGVGLSNRSIMYKKTGEFDKALKDIKEAEEISEKLNRNYSRINNNINVAKLLLSMNRASEAKNYAEKALQLAKNLKSYPEEEAIAHLTLSNIGKKIQNWQFAYEHLMAYITGMDTIRSTESQKNIHDLETKYRTAEKENRIAQLDHENKMKNLELKRRNFQIYALTFSLLSIVLIAFLFYNRYRLKVQKQKAELEQKLLRSQMNPHFIFNTLNAINHYIQTDKTHQASDYLAQYSKLMRQILENSANEFIVLSDEIEFLHNYLSMQQLRFNKSFAFEILVDETVDSENIEIPPMIAQPFIENAVEHGIRKVSDGKIQVSFKMKNHTLKLIVTDNGKGFNATERNIEHQSFAMDITRQRLNINTDKTEKFKILSPDPDTGNGTRVTIDLPYRTFN